MSESEVFAFTLYEWDCPCGEVNRCESDPAGESVTCDGCEETSRVVETR